MNHLPDDLLIDAAGETLIRQDLVLTALGKRPADTLLRVGRLLDAHTRTWREDQEIAIKGRRIAWVGPAGEYQGEAANRARRLNLAAAPGFGEVHKHIESSHLTPEWEAAMVLPRGNTWTCEASHEFANVDGPHNLEFWLEARKRGSPLKIFLLPGSAVPPTAYEWGGGHYSFVIVPSQATAPALVLVGVLMMQGLGRIDLSDLLNAVPIVLTLLVTVLTNNLINGMAMGTFAYILMLVAVGRAREVTGVVWGLGAVFIAFFYTTTLLM